MFKVEVIMNGPNTALFLSGERRKSADNVYIDEEDVQIRHF